MTRFRVGVQLQPQHTSMAELLNAFQAADQLGLDSIFTWDHFFPLYGPSSGRHFEGLTVLAAAAMRTTRAELGAMVAANSYRNPNLMAYMAGTINHLSGGRYILGMGSGWAGRDYREYGYEFGTAASRLRDLRHNLPMIKDRLSKLKPPLLGRLPILIGGAGEQVTLRLVARYADMWNTFGPPANYARKHAVLVDWCAKEGRDPAAIECTVNIGAGDIDDWEKYLRAGAQHLIVELGQPFNLRPLERLLKAATS